MKIWIFWSIVFAVALFVYREKIARDIVFARTDFKKWAYLKWKNWGEPLLIAAILAIAIRTFIIGPYKIPSGSMKPTFIEEDKIFVDKISYRFHEPARGDVIVFKYPLDRKKDFVKRLVGLPGETIEIRDGVILVDGKPMTRPPFSKNHYYNVEDWEYGASGRIIKVPDGHYFTLGDNSAHSADSRQWGFVPRKDVIGKASVIWWPPKRIRLVK
ncbi:MAG TPA: signal peptidase I [Candidatus Omnitrophota bacterium]|jgi:signal peptidase I|nr:signal peptidase I [Candidatus Omnitrophota bacterium]